MVTVLKVAMVCLCASGAALVLCRAYLRIAHPFWSREPVSHHHDVLSYWHQGSRIVDVIIKPPGIQGTRFKTTAIASMTDSRAADLCSLHSKHYPSTNPYQPRPGPFKHRLLYPGARSFAVVATTGSDLRGFITGQELRIAAFGHRHAGYLVDNLCVHSDFRKKGVATSLIAETAYEAGQLAKGAAVCIFKREGARSPYRPLVTTRGVQVRRAQLGAAGPHASVVACEAGNVADELGFEEACLDALDHLQVACLPPARGWYAHFLSQRGNYIVKCSDYDRTVEGYLCASESAMIHEGKPVLTVLSFLPVTRGGKADESSTAVAALAEALRLSGCDVAHVELLGSFARARLPAVASEWEVAYYGHNIYNSTVPPRDFICLV